MNTIILLVGLTIICAIPIKWLFNKCFDGWACTSLSVSVICGTIALIMAIVMLLDPPAQINLFVKQKAYISAVDSDTFQSAGITLEKIKQNKWLYNVQFTRERFGDWGIYPALVLDLEPIE